MPFYEAPPTSRTQIAAGWVDPLNGYAFDVAYTYAETDNAEEEYDGYTFPLTGNEVIDKVFIKIHERRKVTTVIQGDSASWRGIIRVYDGSSWTNYQVTEDAFDVTTANDESLTSESGNALNSQCLIDVTATIDTVAKLHAAKTRLLFMILGTAAGITLRWSVDAITMIVCYSYSDSVPATIGTAKTRKDPVTKEFRAIQKTSEALRTASQSHT